MGQMQEGVKYYEVFNWNECEADRLRAIYTGLIWSPLDYGRIVYNSASDTKKKKDRR